MVRLATFCAAGSFAVTVATPPPRQSARAVPGAFGAAAEVRFQTSRLRNSWGLRLGAVLNSPGEHPMCPGIADWMRALEDRRHAERWKLGCFDVLPTERRDTGG